MLRTRLAAALVLGGGLVLGGCSGEDAVPTSPRPARTGIVLDTNLGPVVLRGVGDDPGDGTRSLHLDATGDDGRTVRRTLWMRTAADPDRHGFYTTTYVFLADGEARLRMSRTVRDGSDAFLEAELEGDGDRLHLRSRPAEGGLGVYVAAVRNGEERALRRTLDPARLSDPSYGAKVSAELEALYPSGPLVDGWDRRLLDAVLGSPTWAEVMGEVPAAGLGTLDADDESVARNIRRLCAVSALAGKLGCMAAQVFPYAWIVCVPATGINLACLALQIFQEFHNNLDDLPCSSCPDTVPDPDPEP